METKHKWSWDWPWHMVDLRDWLYMVNTGYIYPAHYLHVRIFGVCSTWQIESAQQNVQSDATPESSIERDRNQFLREHFKCHWAQRR